MSESSYDLSGNCEIELPKYMTMVQPQDGDETFSFGPIIAVGIFPGSSLLISMTNEGKFFEIDIQKFFSSEDVIEEVIPTHKGKVLEFTRSDMIVEVNSDEILTSSTSINLVDLEIGMGHENNDREPKKDDQGRG